MPFPRGLCGKRAFDEFGAGVDVEDKGRVRHGEHIELVVHDKRGYVDLFVNGEVANLLQPGHVRGLQDRFGPVPALAGVVDADGPDIDSLGRRCQDKGRRYKQRERTRARWISHGVWLQRTGERTDVIRMHGPQPASCGNIAFF